MKKYKAILLVVLSSYTNQTTSLHSANIKEYLSQKASATKNWIKDNPSKITGTALAAAALILAAKMASSNPSVQQKYFELSQKLKSANKQTEFPSSNNPIKPTPEEESSIVLE